MYKTALAAASLAGAFACVLSSVQAGTLIPVPQVPGSTATYIAAINNNNVIVGNYDTADGAQHGFVGTLDGQYTSFDAPNANGGTFASRINDAGTITVLSSFPTQECQYYGCQYLRQSDGSFDAITKGGAQLDGIPEGIIRHNKFVGQYTTDTAGILGYYGKGAKYRADLILPFNTNHTSPRGYREDGTVVGYFRDLANVNHDYPGFILQNGVATAVRYPDPDAFDTVFEGVDGGSIVSGYWANQDFSVAQAFLYNLQTQAFSPLAVAGASAVTAYGINRGGVVAVEADDLPYIYCTKKKSCPLNPAKGKSIPEKWIRVPAANIRTVICQDGCVGPQPAAAAVKPGNAAAVRAAMMRDPDMQPELRLPARP